MEILTRILLLLKEQGKQQKDLADFLGINKNNISDWKSGKSKSYEKYLYQIAEWLNTTPEYLRGETEVKEKTVTNDEFTLEELALIKSYRNKSDEIKKAARAVLGVGEEDYEPDYKLVAFGGDKQVKKTIKPKLT